MGLLKTILPFWQHKVSTSASEILIAPPDDFGTACGFELQFDRLMDDPDAPRHALFPTRSCRA